MTTHNNCHVKWVLWKSSFQFQMTNEDVRLTRPFGGSTISDRAEVAQLVEHLTENQGVTSSILVLGTSAANNIWRLFFYPPLAPINAIIVTKRALTGSTVLGKF